MSVSRKPGAMALTVMPSRPTSRASERVKPSIDALVARIDRKPAIAGEADDRSDVDDAACAVRHHRPHHIFGQHDRRSVLMRTSSSIRELCIIASAPSCPNAALLTGRTAGRIPCADCAPDRGSWSISPRSNGTKCSAPSLARLASAIAAARSLLSVARHGDDVVADRRQACARCRAQGRGCRR